VAVWCRPIRRIERSRQGKKADFTPRCCTDVAPNQGASGCQWGRGGIAAVGVASLQVVNEVLTEIKVHGSFPKFFQQITEVGVVEGSRALFATEGLSLASLAISIERRAHNPYYEPCTFTL
jgi:hypothetical protein